MTSQLFKHIKTVEPADLAAENAQKLYDLVYKNLKDSAAPTEDKERYSFTLPASATKNILCHTLKHPQHFVFGLMIGTVNNNTATASVTEVIPIAHSTMPSPGLLENALELTKTKMTNQDILNLIPSQANATECIELYNANVQTIDKNSNVNILGIYIASPNPQILTEGDVKHLDTLIGKDKSIQLDITGKEIVKGFLHHSIRNIPLPVLQYFIQLREQFDDDEYNDDDNNNNNNSGSPLFLTVVDPVSLLVNTEVYGMTKGKPQQTGAQPLPTFLTYQTTSRKLHQIKLPKCNTKAQPLMSSKREMIFQTDYDNDDDLVCTRMYIAPKSFLSILSEIETKQVHLATIDLQELSEY